MDQFKNLDDFIMSMEEFKKSQLENFKKEEEFRTMVLTEIGKPQKANQAEIKREEENPPILDDDLSSIEEKE